MSSKITYQQIMALEDIASKVYDEQMTFNEGSEYLAEQHGVNINSAKIHIQIYRYLLSGEVFKRDASSEAFDYFLTKIFEKRGRLAHSNALQALELHIEYLEEHNGSERNKTRAVLNEHLSKYY